MKKTWLLSTLLFTACPERSQPESGIVLTYEKPEDAADIRSTVDRRLAALKVKATLHEDSRTLTIRMPNGDGVERVKKTLSRGGRLEFCGEDEVAARQWCAVDAKDLSPTPMEQLCSVNAPSRAAVERAFSDGGVRIGFETTGDSVTAYALEKKCLQPRIVQTRVQEANGQTALYLEFDKPTAAAFGALTGRLLRKRLVIWLDGEVKTAPMIMGPITGGSAMLTLGASRNATEQDLEALSAALLGGALPTMTLKSETTYGPPKLFK
ncbi:MAG: SecDF P1 head subdomain-containing protein [Archangium sp.]